MTVPQTADGVSVTIDGFEITVPKGTLVIRAAEQLGIQIPRFCDHPLLEPVGACRQCLVHIEGQPKPPASCTTVCTDGMVVRSQLTSPVAEKAQRGNLDLSLQVIGRAEAYSTVTVQSRVSGQLQSIAFTPGGHVHAGQMIAKIDPSLLQAQLDQSRGNVARDQAQLANAQAVLHRYEPLLAKGYVSKTDYDNYKANVGIYAAAVKADLEGSLDVGIVCAGV